MNEYTGKNAVEYLNDFIIQGLSLTAEDWENLEKLGYSRKRYTIDMNYEYWWLDYDR